MASAVESAYPPRLRVAWSRLPLAVACVLVGIVALQILTGVGGHAFGAFCERWLYEAVSPLTALSCVIGGARRPERLAWWCVGLAILSWGAGDIYYTFALEGGASIPYPSLADAGYLGFYPLAYAGLVLLVRSTSAGFVRTLWLDSLIAGLTVAALGASLVLQVVLHSLGDSFGISAAVVTNLAYPLADTVLIAAVFAVVSLGGWKLTRGWLQLVAGFAVFGLADSTYLFRAAKGTYVFGTLLDLGWLVGMLLLAASAFEPWKRVRAVALERRRVLLVPMLFAFVALTLEGFDHFLRLNSLALTLASLALAVVILRMGLTFDEYLRVLSGVRHDAVTDPLTGLGNRRALLSELERILAPHAPTSPSRLLLLFDLDGFKSYNDRFGHPAGDALLVRLGDRLRAAIADRGAAYRLGGDEFCAIVASDGSDRSQLRRRLGDSLTESGEGFAIGASAGTVFLPDEVDDATIALRLADRRMYQEKTVRRARQGDGHEALLGVLEARDPRLAAHTSLVTELSEAIARELGVAAGELRTLRMTAELHDIGKVAVPDAILDKPDSLTPEEWELVRQHTVAGERIVTRVPGFEEVGEAIRATHERWDGTGYPDGLRGDEIPRAARIVAVADAFEAMTTGDRPYRAQTTIAAATAEIEACAGTQFDPQVVGAFLTVLERKQRRRGVLAAVG
jgi:two-component system cell cycle response regulator